METIARCDNANNSAAAKNKTNAARPAGGTLTSWAVWDGLKGRGFWGRMGWDDAEMKKLTRTKSYNQEVARRFGIQNSAEDGMCQRHVPKDVAVHGTD